jgi:hypothetical protein
MDTLRFSSLVHGLVNRRRARAGFIAMFRIGRLPNYPIVQPVWDCLPSPSWSPTEPSRYVPRYVVMQSIALASPRAVPVSSTRSQRGFSVCQDAATSWM